MKLSKAAGIIRQGIAETLSFYYFPREHWLRIRTKNILRYQKFRTTGVSSFVVSF
jgi:putative transposase